jgi:hypothetical protein
MDKNALDRYITGNYGEDQFYCSEELDEDETVCAKCERAVNMHDEPVFPVVCKPVGIPHYTVYYCKECANA